MPKKTVTLSGWKAVLVLVVLAGVVGFRITTARAQLDTQGRALLERWVRAELIRPILADTGKTLAEQGAAIERASTVTIKSIAVRGRLSKAVLRVELDPSPALPPGTALVRYYRAHYSDGIGWFHDGPTTALRWYLSGFTF
jgi:hypothetical protein